MTRSDNGNYYWTGTFDKEYEVKQYRIVWIVIGIMCLFLTVFGAILCLPSGDWEMFMAFALPCLIAMIIAVAVIAFFNSGPGATRSYGMSETSIWIKTGRRTRADFFFASAKHVIFTDTYIEPVQAFGGFRIYVPEEDMPFVKDFVLQRLPSTCEIEDNSHPDAGE